MEYANSLVGADAYCFKAFAEAMEVIPYTLAENAGLNPIATVTELRNRHAQVESLRHLIVNYFALLLLIS
jgi:T-complex protein 1 subunit delta